LADASIDSRSSRALALAIHTARWRSSILAGKWISSAELRNCRSRNDPTGAESRGDADPPPHLAAQMHERRGAGARHHLLASCRVKHCRHVRVDEGTPLLAGSCPRFQAMLVDQRGQERRAGARPCDVLAGLDREARGFRKQRMRTRKFHDRVGVVVLLAHEIHGRRRQFVAQQRSIRVHPPAAEPIEQEQPKQIGVERRTARPRSPPIDQHGLGRQNIACVHGGDPGWKAVVAFIGEQFDGVSALDERGEAQQQIGVERRAVPETPDNLGHRLQTG